MSRMFKKILIANRGEIALRVICACRELGIKTVAVYSEADENSLHVRFADEDVCIGPPRSADSYLNVPAIISAAEITGADAIHPGYGFLSESAYLAEVCEACHIRFIGPDPNVIRLLGDKARARRAMKKAGVPMLPGSDGPVESEEKALKVAKDIGYPVIIKAVAGGGGRGMRVVRDAGRAAATRCGPRSARPRRRSASATSTSRSTSRTRATSSSRSSATTTATSSTSASASARSSAATRSCSRSRRRRRSPTRCARKMGSLVVDAAKAVQYTNAGTFEFLMDDEGKFYFMEVNTRLQVEHPVTEMVTGIDIVKEQIRIAAGERLSFKQSDVTFTGHAIECRVNAEDPETFAPSPGVIHAFSVPGGPGVRVDTFAHSECTVSPYYDSMIAKIIVHGRDRQEAIARMRRTLEMTVIEGIKTSIPLHLKILNDPDFVAGRLSTALHGALHAAEPKRAAGEAADRSSAVRLGRVTERSCRRPVSALTPSSTSTSCGARAAGRRSTSRAACLDGGARLLQLRAKQLAVRARFLELCDARRRGWRSRYGAPVIVNDRADLARMSRRRRRARRPGRSARRPTRARIARAATRSSAARRTRIAQIDAALDEPVDLHRGRPGLRHARPRTPATTRVGLDLVAAAAGARRGMPVVAIGGITLETAPAVIAAGAAAVAVIGDLLVGGDPEARVRAFAAVLSRSAFKV